MTRRAAAVSGVTLLSVTIVAVLASDAIAQKVGWIDSSCFPIFTAYIFSWLSSSAWAGAGALATALIAPALYVAGRRAGGAADEAAETTAELTKQIAHLAEGTHDLQVQLAEIAKAARLESVIDLIERASTEQRLEQLADEALVLSTGDRDTVQVASAYYANQLGKYPKQFAKTPFTTCSTQVLTDIVKGMVNRLDDRYGQGIDAQAIYDVRSLARLCVRYEVSLRGVAEFIVNRQSKGDRLTVRSVAMMMTTRSDSEDADWQLMGYTLGWTLDRIEEARRHSLIEQISGLGDRRQASEPWLTKHGARTLMWGVGEASVRADGAPDEASLKRLEECWPVLLDPRYGLVEPPEPNGDEENAYAFEQFVSSALSGIAAVYAAGGRARGAVLHASKLVATMDCNPRYRSRPASPVVEWNDAENPEPDDEPEPGELVERAVNRIGLEQPETVEVWKLRTAVEAVYPHMSTLHRKPDPSAGTIS